MSLSRPAPQNPPPQPDADAARLNELLQQFREAEDYDTPPGIVGGRDSCGRFARGNLGGPGNPYNRRVAELRRIMLEEVSDDAMRVIIQVLLFKAQSGDLAAIKLVLQYVLGKPTPAPDPDTVERKEPQTEQQKSPQIEPDPERRTSERPPHPNRRSATATSDLIATVTDANGDNGEPRTDANGENGAPPAATASEINDSLSRQQRE